LRLHDDLRLRLRDLGCLRRLRRHVVQMAQASNARRAVGRLKIR
jgi:hypothetical protein